VTETPTELNYEGKIIDNLIVRGKISDFNAIEHLLRQETKKIQKPFLGFIYKPFTSIVSVPSDMNEVALRAFRDSMEHAGAIKCYMLFDCFIAATGLNIEIKNSTSMIVDCGAGKTSITTTRGFEIVKNDILDIAGSTFDEAIQTYLRSKYDLLIDSKEAERIKIEYADFRQNAITDRIVRITGIDKKSDVQKDISIQISEVLDCLKNDVDLLVDKIIRHYEKLEDFDADKIKANGVYLIGNGIKIKGLIELISEKLNVSNKSYSLSSDFMKIGLEKVQSNPEQYKKMFIM